MNYRDVIYGASYTEHLSSMVLKKDEEKEIISKLFIRNYLPNFPQDKTATIADVGCGRGNFIYSCINQGYTNVVGVDLSQSNVDFCTSSGYEVTVKNGKDFLLENPNKFDVIIFNDVIEHLYKDEIIEMLLAIKQALTKKGVAIIKTDNAACNYIACASRYMDFTHEILFCENSMKQVLMATDFKNVAIKGVDIYVFNGLINFLASAFSKVLYKFMYYRNYFFGRTATKIFTKDIIAFAYKEGDNELD